MQDTDFRQYLPFLVVAAVVFVVIAVGAVIWEYKEEICFVAGLIFVGGVLAASNKRGGGGRRGGRGGGRTLNVRIVR
jgi:hypothetical protein